MCLRARTYRALVLLLKMQSLFERFFSKIIHVRVIFLSEITLYTRRDKGSGEFVSIDERRERDSRVARRFSSGRRGTLFFWKGFSGNAFIEDISSSSLLLLKLEDTCLPGKTNLIER